MKRVRDGIDWMVQILCLLLENSHEREDEIFEVEKIILLLKMIVIVYLSI